MEGHRERQHTSWWLCRSLYPNREALQSIQRKVDGFGTPSYSGWLGTGLTAEMDQNDGSQWTRAGRSNCHQTHAHRPQRNSVEVRPSMRRQPG